MPKCGKKVAWQGHEHEVTNVDILRQKISLRDREGSCCCITLQELKEGKAEKTEEQEQPTGETHTSRLGKDRAKPKKQSAKKPRQPEKTTAKEPQKPAEQPRKAQQQSAAEDMPKKKKRRRGRRRPRGGRKPNQTKQGE
jgi:hypothetical protein